MKMMPRSRASRHRRRVETLQSQLTRRFLYGAAMLMYALYAPRTVRRRSRRATAAVVTLFHAAACTRHVVTTHVPSRVFTTSSRHPEK